MASKTNNEELKHLALLKLAEGRAELAAQIDRLRTELNPKLAARRMFEQNTGTVVLATVAVGLAVTVLVLRRRRHAHEEQLIRKERRTSDLDKEPVVSFLGTLMRAVAPTLIKVVVIQPLAQFFAHRGQEDRMP